MAGHLAERGEAIVRGCNLKNLGAFLQLCTAHRLKKLKILAAYAFSLMKTVILILQLIWIIPFSAYAEPVEGDPCDYFFQALKAVPHESMTRSYGAHASLLDGKKRLGCQIKLVTNTHLLSGKKVPDFRADQGSVMYGMGWRMVNELTADGPGSSLYGIRKDSVLCLILYDQPAYLDEKTRRIVQTDTLTITVQCRPNGGRP